MTSRALHLLDQMAQPSAASGLDALRRAAVFETVAGTVIRNLADQVGSLDALLSLDDMPLPDEPFDASMVPGDRAEFCAELVKACDDFCDRSLDVEYRTICRRVVARVLRNEPGLLGRSPSPIRLAAGVVAAALTGNQRLARRKDLGWTQFEIAKAMGITPGSGWPDRLCRAAAFESAYPDVDPRWRYGQAPGPRAWSADALHSTRRRELLSQRADAIEMALADERRRGGRRPVVRVDDVGYDVSVWPARFDFAVGGSAGGQSVIALALAPLTPEDQSEVYSLSVPDARRLRSALETLLDTQFDEFDLDYRVRRVRGFPSGSIV